MKYRKIIKVPENTLGVVASVTPLWAWSITDFSDLVYVVFHFESPAANTQNVTITVRASRFGINPVEDATQTLTLTPGTEGRLVFNQEQAARQFQCEAQSVSGTQNIHFIGEGYN